MKTTPVPVRPVKPVRFHGRVSGAMPRRAWPVIFLILVAAFIAVTDASSLPVTAPLFAGLLAAAAFYWALWSRRSPLVPWFEPGAVYLAMVTLYMAYPLVGYLALGHTYTPRNDSRLFIMQPDPVEVGGIAWMYVSHLIAFALTYVWVRGRLPLAGANLRRPGLPLFLAIAIVYLSIQAFAIGLGLFFDAPAGSYSDTYLAARGLPLILAQLLNHFGGMKHVLSLMLLAALFCRLPGSRPIIAGWIALMAIVSVARLGSRTELVLFVLAAAMMYHLLVRPLGPRVVAATAALGLAGFLAFGLVRGGSYAIEGFARNPFAYSSEFETLFANAVHLTRVKDSLGPLPAAFHAADIAALLPQQFVPFTKIDRADWYVVRFFPEYAARGGGMAFGTIAESTLTGGWISALLRGLLLGFLLAKLHRFYTRHADRFWVFVFYVWVTTLSYQLFRNTTLSLLVLVLYRFLPAVVIVVLLATAIRRTASAGSRAAARRPAGV